MQISIRELIKKEGLDIKDTVYQYEKEEILDFRLTAGDFFRPVWGQDALKKYGYHGEEKIFEYKNRAVITSFAGICKAAPKFGGVKLEELSDMPLLITNLVQISSMVSGNEPIGLVGGPCLFGMDEVLVQIETIDGHTKLFDCSCGRSCTKDKGEPAVTLEAYLSVNQGQVKDAHIINRKTGITRQEWISLLYLFEVAAVLDGKVVVPIPDLSYIKFMSSDLASLEEPLKSRLMQEFKTEAYQITDRYLEAVDRLKTRYPSLQVLVVHDRDKELCQVFYEKREAFIKDSSYMRKITNINGKKDAVIDYITMLALPYYLMGTRNIIQLDSLDETDSGRKCQKIHKKEIVLQSILYPEFLSSDGENTIYNTDITHKEYLEKGDN